jgi:hypothetical protein
MVATYPKPGVRGSSKTPRRKPTFGSTPCDELYAGPEPKEATTVVSEENAQHDGNPPKGPDRREHDWPNRWWRRVRVTLMVLEFLASIRNEAVLAASARTARTIGDAVLRVS